MTRPKYRPDIDGLRAIAVLAVIDFHLGYLPSGFLGVDVFFVISGFLITKLIASDANEGQFSLREFYWRRARRILPLSLFVGCVALLLGCLVMLPDDLENLAQSVVATNLFSNNILQAVTTKNYWDVVNEYKPLMHTWSLGIEEQFYFLYPMLLMLILKLWPTKVVQCVVAMSAISIVLYISNFDAYLKFYHLPFRAFELGIGAIAATLDHRHNDNWMLTRWYAISRFLFVLSLSALLAIDFHESVVEIQLIAVCLVTAFLLRYPSTQHDFANSLLSWPPLVWIGLISYSLYMWHQPVLAFARYIWIEDWQSEHSVYAFAITILLSSLSYMWIERPFRDHLKISKKVFASIALPLLISVTGLALFLNASRGVLRDVPELDIVAGRTADKHNSYNSRIHSFARSFRPDVSAEYIKVLVIGDSFARDWANVLLESDFGTKLDISYVADPLSVDDLIDRLVAADLIFWSRMMETEIALPELDLSKMWIVGTKRFGTSNGHYYNHNGPDQYEQRARLPQEVLRQNDKMAQIWGDRYINMISKLEDDEHKVPIFTKDKKFISYDCRHLTRFGARFLAELLRPQLEHIFKKYI